MKRENICAHFECNKRIRNDHFLCQMHFMMWEDGFVDQCPKCGRFKSAIYELCLDCYEGQQVIPWEPPTAIKGKVHQPDIEHSNVWTKADQGVNRFFVYILKSDDGDFYVGQTRELRERLSEHRDKKTKSTSERRFTLQYFEIWPTRRPAEIREAKMKQLVKDNPRQIRRMIIGFHDLIKEVKME